MGLIGNPTRIGRTLKNAGRIREIASIFAKHGFRDVLERLGVGGTFVGRWIDSGKSSHLSTAERLRMCFEESGATFIKLGQILATRPDLIPPDFTKEFQKLQKQAPEVSFSELKPVLDQNIANLGSVFSHIEEKPLASASIAQVHRARLNDGHEVVIKIQKPGVRETIESDMDVLYFFAELLERNIEEVKIFSPMQAVREFERTLRQETNFIIEANNIRRFGENFDQDEHLKLPEVYLELSSPNVLVMEYLDGPTLSDDNWELVEGLDRDEILRAGIRGFLEMVFSHGFFHGDLHSGNLIILPNNKIGLIDFGAVGRLNRRTQGKIISMFINLTREDYDGLAHDYLDIAPFDERTNVEDFARDLRGLIAPFFGLSMKNVNLGQMLMESTSMASRHHVAVPADLVLFFKSLVAVEGMGKRITEDFDFLPHALEFSRGLIRDRYEPKKVAEDLLRWGKESKELLAFSPRQIKQFLRKVNHPSYEVKLDIKRIERLRGGMVYSAELLFLGLVTVGLLISGSMLSSSLPEGWWPYTPLAFYFGAAFMSFVAIFNYMRTRK